MAAKIKKGLREMRRSENLFCLSFLILFLVQWAIFWVYANINSIEVAFMHYDVTTDKHIFYNGAHLFDNFKRVFQDIGGASGAYVLNGVIMHLLSTIVCLPVSYMIAYILYKKLPGSGFFQTVLYLPVILSVMITVLLFKQIVEGVVQETLLADVLNLHIFMDSKYNWYPVLFYIIFFGLPGNLLINLGSMARVPKELIVYGELEGISMFREFYLVTLPMIFPVLQVQCLGLFTGFFNAKGPLFELYMDGAPENLKTFGYYMFTSVYSGNADAQGMFGYNSAANLVIGLVSIPIVQLTKMLFDKFDPGAEY